MHFGPRRGTAAGEEEFSVTGLEWGRVSAGSMPAPDRRRQGSGTGGGSVCRPGQGPPPPPRMSDTVPACHSYSQV